MSGQTPAMTKTGAKTAAFDRFSEKNHRLMDLRGTGMKTAEF
jgi:hypothetical protein